MSDARTVAVEFVDAATGQPFARSDIPVGQLPETFAVHTNLDLAGQSWTVVTAEPPTAAEFRASGRLVLTLSRAILYSLPTLCAELPPIGPAAPDALVLHEDDWRQVELVTAGLAEVVTAELAEVRRVWEEEAVGHGFRSLHVRAAPVAPLVPPLPEGELLGLLPRGRRRAGVAFGGADGIVVDSFAVDCGPLRVYGLTAGSHVTVLGLQIGGPGPVSGDTAAALAGVLRRFDLNLVDWCRCAVVGPDSLAAYLT
ncbi:hypothetical protein O7635_22305 [Asanoa sp. WMMD1127]|uniref:hypothetical protein n=1 Tax=Asanoa sp. WMMD1127 TaxID=3016107 RepID=UPI002417A791|nr:hypothetical protein [Asanoa sp. WMMD1127]MDG4824591.1 hypothetical protein [Asanoa sp. WMMD1127]